MNWLQIVKLVTSIVIIVWLVGLGVFVLIKKHQYKKKAEQEIKEANEGISNDDK